MKPCQKLINRVIALKDKLINGEVRKENKYIIATSIKKVGDDIDNIKFNTAISQIMVLVNTLERQANITSKEYKTLLLLLNPYAPHITEELWEQCKFAPAIKDVKWPTYNEADLVQDQIELALQINSKIITREFFDTSLDDKGIEEKALENDAIVNALGGRTVVKVVVVKGRLVNIIAK